MASLPYNPACNCTNVNPQDPDSNIAGPGVGIAKAPSSALLIQSRYSSDSSLPEPSHSSPPTPRSISAAYPLNQRSNLISSGNSLHTTSTTPSSSGLRSSTSSSCSSATNSSSSASYSSCAPTSNTGACP